jgi:hypothetical protein
MSFVDASILLTPNAFEAGKLYAIIGTDAVCVRATTANRVNSEGDTETMDADVPLIDYSAGGCPVIDVRSADVITEVVPVGVVRVVLNKEGGAVEYQSVIESTTYTIPVGRYTSIVFDDGVVPPKFLLLENGFNILQENNSKILI